MGFKKTNERRRVRVCVARASLMPRRQRGDADSQARQPRGASAAMSRTSATMPGCQRGDAEVPSPRRPCFVAATALRLDIAGCSYLSRLSSARRVYKNVDQRTHAPQQSITTSRAQRLPTTRVTAQRGVRHGRCVHPAERFRAWSARAFD
jgi:hypothetical protein